MKNVQVLLLFGDVFSLSHYVWGLDNQYKLRGRICGGSSTVYAAYIQAILNQNYVMHDYIIYMEAFIMMLCSHA